MKTNADKLHRMCLECKYFECTEDENCMPCEDECLKGHEGIKWTSPACDDFERFTLKRKSE